MKPEDFYYTSDFSVYFEVNTTHAHTYNNTTYTCTHTSWGHLRGWSSIHTGCSRMIPCVSCDQVSLAGWGSWRLLRVDMEALVPGLC